MDSKWMRQKLNQISGTYLLLDNLLVNHKDLFTLAEIELLEAVVVMLKQKGEKLRGGSPGGG